MQNSTEFVAKIKLFCNWRCSLPETHMAAGAEEVKFLLKSVFFPPLFYKKHRDSQMKTDLAPSGSLPKRL